MTTIIFGDSHSEPSSATVRGGDLWLAAQELEAVTGWVLKPEGLCRDDVCVPVPEDRRGDYEQNGEANLSALWRLLQRPLLHDDDSEIWVLGETADERAKALQSLQAPDFSLPDLDGKMHSLSDYRGKKVLLTTWASW